MRTPLALICLAGTAAPQSLQFSDQTTAAGLIAAPAFPAGFEAGPMLAGGAAVADFDGDGLQDLFVVMGGLEADRLFTNDGTGHFTEDAAAKGLAATHVGAGAAVGDVDGDGLVDLYVVSHGTALQPATGAHRLYMNGGGVFTEQAAARGVHTTSAAMPDGFGAGFGDPDNDGDLDLAVAGWKIGSGGNRLFRNDGGGVFSDATTSMITADLMPVRGFTPVFVDMDGDRWSELLWVADYGGSKYLANQQGQLVDQTSSSGTGLERNGMGQAVGDLDGDGLLDWFVTAILGDTTPHWKGNQLYLAQGDHVYSEGGGSAGVADGGWGWGVVAVDLDQDGDVDLCETNGWFESEFYAEQAYLWLNDGSGVFAEQAAACQLSYGFDGLGLVRFDADGDGDQDLVFTSNQSPLVYYRNDLAGPRAHWLTFRLDRGAETDVAPHGYGARVTVEANSTQWVVPVSAGGSYLSQSELSAHFGLGSATRADSVRVDWPNGTTTWLEDVNADQDLTVKCCAGWTDLGFGLGGVLALPRLTGQGALTAGSKTLLELDGGPAGAPSVIAVGFAPVNLPLFGGVLVPSPDLVAPYALDAQGELSLSFAWPSGLPPASQTWWQVWALDPSMPEGFVATNALRARMP